MNEVQLSEKFAIKLLRDTLNVKDLNLIQQFYYYITDSKYRTVQRLDRFLFKPLSSPQEELVNVALKYAGLKTDKAIIQILNYVHNRIKYVSDLQKARYIERWSDPYYTWLEREDDCEGQNGLIYHLARLSGIPSYLLWCCIGEAESPVGGHFWLLYISPRTGKVYPIDATAWYDSTGIYRRKSFDLGENKRYKKIWYIFNERYCFRPI